MNMQAAPVPTGLKAEFNGMYKLNFDLGAGIQIAGSRGKFGNQTTRWRKIVRYVVTPLILGNAVDNIEINDQILGFFRREVAQMLDWYREIYVHIQFAICIALEFDVVNDFCGCNARRCT